MRLFSGGAFDDPRRRTVALTLAWSGILTLVLIVVRTVLIGLSPERQFLWNIEDDETFESLGAFEVGARFVTVTDTALTFLGFGGIFVGLYYAEYVLMTYRI